MLFEAMRIFEGFKFKPWEDSCKCYSKITQHLSLRVNKISDVGSRIIVDRPRFFSSQVTNFKYTVEVPQYDCVYIECMET